MTAAPLPPRPAGSRPFLYLPAAESVATDLVATGAYMVRAGVGRDLFLDWKAGPRFAPVYCDVLRLLGDAGTAARVGAACAGAVRDLYPDADLVVGLAEAGISLAAMTAQALGLPQAFVRKEHKDHGLPGRVACHPRPGSRAVLVDDLVATGRSVLAAAEVLREQAGVETLGVLSVVNWALPVMWTCFAETPFGVTTLATHTTVLPRARELGMLTAAAVDELAAFYRDPLRHVWNLAALAPPAGARAEAARGERG
jgi:orotate phosphoribosyltransferase